MALYSVVVPVYNSEHTLEELYERLCGVFDRRLREDFELLLVDDGSKDRSYEVMKSIRERDRRVKIFQMARNFGQHPAILCGLHYVSGDFVITMDDDLQHPPEEIPKLIGALEGRDDVDVVVARYVGRQHNAVRRLGTRIYAFATARMFRQDPSLELTSFRLMRRFIADAIKDTTVHRPVIGNLLIATSNRIINVDVEHHARAYGRSGYSFRALASMLYYDVTTHSVFPLILMRNIGIATFLLSVVLGIVYFVRYLTGRITVRGWTSLFLLLLASTGLTLLAAGILGDYMMHVLDESKKQPHYVLRRKETDGPGEEGSAGENGAFGKKHEND